MKLRIVASLLVIALSLPGCGAAKNSSDFRVVEEATSRTTLTSEMEGETGDQTAASPQAALAIERRIVYTAHADVVVEDIDQVPAQVDVLVQKHGGYIARSNVFGRPGTPRSGEWSLRVPVAAYEDFLTAVRELGEIRSIRTDSNDVTAEYYDVEARIRIKKEEETRLLKHLEESTGKLVDILAVEKELSRVRGEVEQMEGRMRVLKDLTTLTTVNLKVEEIKQYVPEGEASYLTRVQRSFSSSITAFVDFAQTASIVAIASLPWLGVLLVVVLVVRFVLRRSSRRAT